ncbi:MAG: hypothetical protein LBB47_05685 [Spirochaetaceae bacterium]|jgi:hypothetical protein|nr:hypothetical protein [Spirochaetaceae bacterium]
MKAEGAVMFKPTAAQRKALALIKSGAKHILLFGGSRSGKTTVLVMAVIYRAVRYAGSRHLICRLRAKDARSSVLRETLLPLLTNTIGNSNYSHNVHSDLMNLPALKGGASCKRCIIYEVRSVRKFIVWVGLLPFYCKCY